MSENNQNTELNVMKQTEPTGEKTFTQEEVNAIVQKRIKSYSDYDELKAKAEKLDRLEEESKSELQKATERADGLQAELDSLKKAEATRLLREQIAERKGVPASLLTEETEEKLEEQADAILSFAKPGAYPAVKDAGEVNHTAKKSTRDQFADWINQK